MILQRQKQQSLKVHQTLKNPLFLQVLKILKRKKNKIDLSHPSKINSHNIENSSNIKLPMLKSPKFLAFYYLSLLINVKSNELLILILFLCRSNKHKIWSENENWYEEMLESGRRGKCFYILNRTKQKLVKKCVLLFYAL